jgi:hypothetical protein
MKNLKISGKHSNSYKYTPEYRFKLAALLGGGDNNGNKT